MRSRWLKLADLFLDSWCSMSCWTYNFMVLIDAGQIQTQLVDTKAIWTSGRCGYLSNRPTTVAQPNVVARRTQYFSPPPLTHLDICTPTFNNSFIVSGIFSLAILGLSCCCRRQPLPRLCIIPAPHPTRYLIVGVFLGVCTWLKDQWTGCPVIGSHFR